MGAGASKRDLDFRKFKGWEDSIPQGTLTASADAQISTHFADDNVAQEFLNFHHDRAVLRIIGRVRPPISISAAIAVNDRFG